MAIAPILVHQAIREHRSGRLDIAADLYRRAIEADPLDADALHLLGTIHLQRGDQVASAGFAAKAVLAEPAMARAYNNLGLILKDVGQPASAARCYLHAIRIAPNLAEAHSNLGVALKAAGQTALAIQHYRLAVELDPSLGEAHNNLGNALQELGEIEEAVEAYLSASERMPDSDTVSYNVGLLLMRLGRREDALVHLRHALEIAPQREDARHLVAALEGETTATAPGNYVQRLFDSYAPRFEAHLVGELQYRAHVDAAELIDAVVGPRRRFTCCYDLGCGTGLVGALVRERTDRLVGIDLSENMLCEAERKGIYDTLVRGDIHDVLDRVDERGIDLMLACDVVIYMGDISGTVERVARRLSPGGLFAFSTEAAPDGVRWSLRPSGRYAHGDDYMREVLSTNGLVLLARRPIVVRRESDEPIAGAVYLAVKPAPGRVAS